MKCRAHLRLNILGILKWDSFKKRATITPHCIRRCADAPADARIPTTLEPWLQYPGRCSYAGAVHRDSDGSCEEAGGRGLVAVVTRPVVGRRRDRTLCDRNRSEDPIGDEGVRSRRQRVEPRIRFGSPPARAADAAFTREQPSATAMFSRALARGRSLTGLYQDASASLARPLGKRALPRVPPLFCPSLLFFCCHRGTHLRETRASQPACLW